jgi:hypothetical protein
MSEDLSELDEQIRELAIEICQGIMLVETAYASIGKPLTGQIILSAMLSATAALMDPASTEWRHDACINFARRVGFHAELTRLN